MLGAFSDGNSSCTVPSPSRIPVRLSTKDLTYRAGSCTPLGSISGLHKAISGSLGGLLGFLAKGGVEDDASMSSGGNGNGVLLGNKHIRGSSAHVSPIPFPICLSKLADENPLSQSVFPLATAFKMSG